MEKLSAAGIIGWIGQFPRRAAQDTELMDLAGFYEGDEEWEDFYTNAQKDLESIIQAAEAAHEEINQLRLHAHDWNEDDYCSMCGADGRA